MFAAAAFVSVDERVVFGRCLPRWEIARFVSTFTRPPATWSVGMHRLLVQAQLSAMRSCTPGFRGCAPMMGAAVVVRNAECGPGAELVGAHQSWVHLGLSAMRSLNRSRVVVSALLVEYWRSSLSVYAGVLDIRYSTFAEQEASSLLRVLSPQPMWPLVDRSRPAG